MGKHDAICSPACYANEQTDCRLPGRELDLPWRRFPPAPVQYSPVQRRLHAWRAETGHICGNRVPATGMRIALQGGVVTSHRVKLAKGDSSVFYHQRGEEQHEQTVTIAWLRVGVESLGAA
jgi:hypothetical protein